MVINSTNIIVDIGGIVDHHCLVVIVCFVDIGGIVDHHCLVVIVCFVDIGGIDDHHCLVVIASIPPISTKQTITSKQ
jgi:hypothetical protein